HDFRTLCTKRNAFAPALEMWSVEYSRPRSQGSNPTMLWESKMGRRMAGPFAKQLADVYDVLLIRRRRATSKAAPATLNAIVVGSGTGPTTWILSINRPDGLSVVVASETPSP